LGLLVTGIVVAFDDRMSALCNELDRHVPEIIDEWKRLTDRSPWNCLSSAAWSDHLPPVLHALIQASLCTPDSPPARQLLVGCASAHGETRRGQGFSTDELLEEHYLLRRSIWDQMRTISASAAALAQSVEEIVRVDAALTIVTIAAMLGFHRQDSEPSSAWPRTLAELTRRWEAAIVAET
jgi:hypothetical protein